jgi:hypothetical protein
MMGAITTRLPFRDTPPPCPSCGRALQFARTVPQMYGLAELETLSCRECSLWVTQAAEQRPHSKDF